MNVSLTIHIFIVIIVINKKATKSLLAIKQMTRRDVNKRNNR